MDIILIVLPLSNKADILTCLTDTGKKKLDELWTLKHVSSTMSEQSMSVDVDKTVLLLISLWVYTFATGKTLSLSMKEISHVHEPLLLIHMH